MTIGWQAACTMACQSRQELKAVFAPGLGSTGDDQTSRSLHSATYMQLVWDIAGSSFEEGCSRLYVRAFSCRDNLPNLKVLGIDTCFCFVSQHLAMATEL